MSIIIVFLGNFLVANGDLLWGSNSCPHPAAQAASLFAFDLAYCIERHMGSGKNFVFAPTSIYANLASLESGMVGETWFQVNRALALDRLRNRYRDVNQMLRRISEDTTGAYNATVRYGVMYDRSLRLSDHYRSVINGTVGSYQSRVSFALMKAATTKRDRQGSKLVINEQVRDWTRGDIHQYIRPEQLGSNTRLLPVEVFSLMTDWESAFDARLSAYSWFKVTQHQRVSVPFMVTGRARCYISSFSSKFDNTAMLIVPFKDNKLTAIVVMPPTPGDFSRLEHGDFAKRMTTALNKLPRESDNSVRYNNCQVRLPKFHLSTDIEDMPVVLRNVGVHSMFESDRANLTRLVRDGDDKGLAFDGMIHRARLNINEQGITPSGSPMITTRLGNRPWSVIPIVISQPFIFMVKHEETGAILIYSKVYNPLES